MIDIIDDLMRKRGISAVLCYGDTTLGNPELVYLTRTTLPRGGVYLKKRGEEPLLVVSSIDVGHAKRGMVKEVQTYNDYDYPRIVKRYGRQKAFIELLATLLRRHRVKGKIAVYGRNEFCHALFIADKLRRRGHKIIGEPKPTILDVARRTKDGWEISALKTAAEKTLTVVRKVEKLLEELDLRGGTAAYDGKTVTVGAVKRMIRIWCSEAGLTLPEDFILATGPSSADPHEAGIETSPIREGEPILFDIFPQDETGYWFDFTRTYVLGRPSKELAKMYDEVAEAQRVAFDHISEGVKAEEPMLEVCRYFIRNDRLTPLNLIEGNREAESRGFIHSLGHGVGLTIGEEPYLTLYDNQPLQAGMVVTVEPGLYYPEVGGVRLEDAVVVRKGKPELLAEHQYRLEL